MPRPSKTSTAASAKKPAKYHAQLSPTDVDSIIEGTLNAAPVTPTSSPKKCKTAIAISDDDSSEIEIIENPQPSPKKARAATPPPSPGTLAFKDLPPVSISDMLDDLSRPGTAISFGTTGRPTRNKIKTEKGVVLEELKAARKSRVKVGKATVAPVESVLQSPAPITADLEPIRPETPKVKRSPAKNTATHKTPKSKAVDDDAVMSSPSPIRDLRKSRKVPSKLAISDDELPLVSELLLSPKKNKTATPSSDTRSLPLAKILDLEAVSDDETTRSDPSSDKYLDTDDDGEVGYCTDPTPAERDSDDDSPPVRSEKGSVTVSPADDDAADHEDALEGPEDAPEDPDAVTSSLYQDPLLRRIYENLPFLPKMTPILPFSQTFSQASALTSERLSFSNIVTALNKSEADSLLKAMLFTQSGVHVNLSRIHPNLLQQEGGRIRMKRPDNASAVALYTGMTMKSAIEEVDYIGPLSSQYGVHGIAVAGTDQDTRRYMAILGVILRHDSITGNISKDGLSFYTRGQGKDGNFGPPPPTTAGPATSTHPMAALMSSVALHAPASNAQGYPGSRSFDERIPVYDGRVGSGRKFNFTDDDFKSLPTWPLYRRGKGEVDLGALVSVGHTISTYNGYSGRILSSNIQFVIVLGKPAIGL